MEKIINMNCLDYMRTQEFQNIVKTRKVVIISDPPFNIGYHYKGYKDKNDYSQGKTKEELERLKAIKRIRETDISVDFETNGCETINDIKEAKKDLDIIEEDLIILEILAQCLIFRESYYHNQADYSAESISMGFLDKQWTPEKIYNRVREWCFKHKIRGTEE